MQQFSWPAIIFLAIVSTLCCQDVPAISLSQECQDLVYAYALLTCDYIENTIVDAARDPFRNSLLFHQEAAKKPKIRSWKMLAIREIKQRTDIPNFLFEYYHNNFDWVTAWHMRPRWFGLFQEEHPDAPYIRLGTYEFFNALYQKYEDHALEYVRARRYNTPYPERAYIATTSDTQPSAGFSYKLVELVYPYMLQAIREQHNCNE